MKLVIVLFAVIVAVNAYPGIPWAAPVPVVSSHPWAQPAPWQPPVIAHPPAYIKVAAPVSYAKVHAPAVHHVISVPQPAPIPPLHPQPLNIKVPHTESVRLPLHGVKIPHPHLVGIEHYVPEPEIKVVAKPVHSVHPW